ncbi:N-acylneuraminate cytidylyltransferase [Colwellia chukchiensis]|uniref:N-acylneuraminate cytidylyltransferase n=1 Tax=Colwellia chukchiensis TaxID=641665 RepID=A0A1H7HGG7_9GAMM|nr:acylneuraminate cytidylyltransferase family protein [Colwellia chukchiensis]SEK49443.1 N-acylneuraminate cytidylyltransferase [Colwellia chukchiensis]
MAKCEKNNQQQQSAKILAIIPARAGSKRLPGKNSKLLYNKPLIQWTIEAAQGCVQLTDIVVSTDSVAIANIAADCGLPVPFMRPKVYAGDKSTAIDVIEHAIEFFAAQQKHYDYVLWLQPTSPLRTTEDINAAIATLMAKEADAVISVCPCDHSPLWSNTLDETASMDNFLSPFVKNNPRSQALPDYYRLNGAIYLAKTAQLLQEKSFFLTQNVFAYQMAKESSIDIDSRLDFTLAELLLTERLRR